MARNFPMLFTVLLALSGSVSINEPAQAANPSMETAEQQARRHELVRQRRARIHIICHRGASEFAHENTLEAYRATFELGADGNEIDIRSTKDGVLVCFHDDMLDQLLAAFGDVGDHTWDELRRFPFREPGPFAKACRIPTLAEVFELHRQFGGLMHLDIKRPRQDQAIQKLLDEFDLWDHVAYCNGDHGGVLLTDPRLKLCRYKSGLYLDHAEVFPDAIVAALEKPGDGFIVDDPRGAILALGRKLGTVSQEPVSEKLAVQQAVLGELDPLTLLAVLKGPHDGSQVAQTEDEQNASGLKITARARAADQLARLPTLSPEVIQILEEQVSQRSLHKQWQYHGLDGAMALRSLVLLRAPRAVEVARFSLWRDDPALEPVIDPRFKNPRAWTDFRVKMVVFPALARFPSEATEKLCRDYLALGDEDAQRLGPPLFEQAARTLLTVSPQADVAAELMGHRLQVVRGRAILICLQHGAEPWARETLEKHARHALAYLAEPQWIWGTERDRPERWRFSRRFDETESIQSAQLRFAADYCRAEVTINGQTALRVEPYCPTQRIDVTSRMRRRENHLVVSVEPVAGPAAWALTLEWKRASGSGGTLVSDRQWTVEPLGGAEPSRAAVEVGPVPPELWGRGRRDIRLAPDENYEQWQQTLGADASQRKPRIWTVPGFEVTVLRVAQPDEGSWISMAFDARGRLTISREDRGLLRMTLDEPRRTVSRVERISVGLDECRGLLYDDGWLYANANNSKTLFRLRVADDASVRDLTRLREFPGGVGHGRNDLSLGSDGLYSIHGDSVDVPRESIEDLTSPLREARRTTSAREGHLVRANRVGLEWELLCAGLRNPYGIAVHPQGDRFSFDADNEYDMGAPWYRPTRIVSLVTGGDLGYREATGSWPPRFPDQPDNTQPVLDIGRSSPTAVMFGGALQFPPAYRRALFALDWTYGRVLAVHLAPRGAGWRAAAELFLQGRPLNVTDIAAGPDGAMYLVTGGRNTQSALYRVAHVDLGVEPLWTSRHEETSQRFAETQRERRQTLENSARHRDAGDLEHILLSLVDADPGIRYAARIALERLPLAAWRSRVLSAPAERTALQGLLALARAGDAADVPAVLDRLTQIHLHELPVGEQLIWVRICRLCFDSAPDVVRARRDVLASTLVAAWPSRSSQGRRVAPEGSNDELRQRIALLLGELDDSELPRLAVEDLFGSDVQEDRLAGLLALRNQRTGWSAPLRRRQFETLQDVAHMEGGQGMPTFRERLRADSLASLTDAERPALEDLLKSAAVIANPLPPPRPLVRRWTLAELAELETSEPPRGNVGRGKTVFQEALCGRCHRVGKSGAAVGPELTFVARRFSRRNMLESILTPSLSVAENYRNVILVTEQGQVHTGRVVSEGDYRSQKLRLNPDALRLDQVVEIDKRDIAELRLAETSPMPQGLLDTFTLEDIRDLLAYLRVRA